MHTNFEPITGAGTYIARPLFDQNTLSQLEQVTIGALGPHTLMQRAGLAVARFTMAIAPHAQRIWIPCGPGNNGGDGMEAAIHLKGHGKTPVVTLAFPHGKRPADAEKALQRARQAGVQIETEPPANWDLCVDALFGIGPMRPMDERCQHWIQSANLHTAPVLAVDVASGLNAFTGEAGPNFVKANFTLTLLGAKPGLFTADGRDASGEIWLHRLGVACTQQPCAILNATPVATPRSFNSHKGTYGDVAVVGGGAGMTGAAILAALGALHGGAGRIYTVFLDSEAVHGADAFPELMVRDVEALDYANLCVVAGCGGGTAIERHLQKILLQSGKLVLDADALNAIAASRTLADLLKRRAVGTTVLTPHPLEAARLLKTDTADVQANRLKATQKLAHEFLCTVVLKGSGTVIATPHQLPAINPTGNAQLATAGTGDVLAGLLGARLAAGASAHDAACAAVFLHGHAADIWKRTARLTASGLAVSL